MINKSKLREYIVKGILVKSELVYVEEEVVQVYEEEPKKEYEEESELDEEELDEESELGLVPLQKDIFTHTDISRMYEACSDECTPAQFLAFFLKTLSDEKMVVFWNQMKSIQLVNDSLLYFSHVEPLHELNNDEKSVSNLAREYLKWLTED